MAKVIGRLTTIFIGKETTRGTLGTPEFAVPVRAIDIDDVPTYLDNDSGYGVIAEHNDSDLNTIQGEGGYDGKVFDHIIGAELRATLGQAPTTAPVSGQAGVFQHDFALANNNSHSSLSIFTKEDASKSFSLGMVETFSLTAALDDYLARAIAFKSRASEDWTPSTPPAYVRGNEFMVRDLAVKTAANAAGLNAATASKVTAFSLEIAKNLDVQFVFGTATPDDIQNQQINVTGSFDYRREDETVRGYVTGNVKRAVRFEATSGATIGTSAHPSLRFDLPYVAFKEDSRSRDNNAVETRTANFQANYSIEEAALITARLINTVSAY